MIKEENSIEPDMTVEFLFIEKAEIQSEPINDNQGYMAGFINIFWTGEKKNGDLETISKRLHEELNYCVGNYDEFNEKVVNFEDYKFALIDNDMKLTIYLKINEKFINDLQQSLGNLIIVGKNFNLDSFTKHWIFYDWYDEYTNRFY